jgi:hypothetical protein
MNLYISHCDLCGQVYIICVTDDKSREFCSCGTMLSSVLAPVVIGEAVARVRIHDPTMKTRLGALTGYYQARGRLIMSLLTALKNVLQASCLEGAKQIAEVALAQATRKSPKCHPNLYPDGVLHTGHPFPEYLELPCHDDD